MSLFSPSDPPQALTDDPVGGAGLHTAGWTAVVSADVLWILGTYVWHGTVPEQVTWTVALVVPYVVSQAASRLVRRRAVAAVQCPAGAPPAAAEGTPAPPVAPGA